jgi:predicted dehydrogenase
MSEQDAAQHGKSTDGEVRIGIIGVGIGQAHIKGYSKNKAARVVALCDLDQNRAQSVAQDCGVGEVKIFTDHRAMLDSGLLDAVSVCLPNKLHAPVSIDALQAGLHVLCEKPLAIDAASAQAIADAADKSGKKCMVAQVKRFTPEAQVLKRLVDSGQLGRLYYEKAVWLRKRGIPGYGGWFTTKAASGGGPLIDIGVHLLDAAWWLAGCPKPVSVYGATYAEFGPRGLGMGGYGLRSDRDNKPSGTFDVEDLAVGLIRFEGGLTINLEVSWALHQARERQVIEIFGADGGAEWGDALSIFRDIEGASTNARLEVGRGDAWAGETQHFIDCILNNTTPDPDARQGVTMMKMLEGLYKSAEAQREVAID